MFQSTLPVKGATRSGVGHTGEGVFQSTLPVKGATPATDDPHYDDAVSIHAPREGSDTALADELNVVGFVSIHAPREGSDNA